MPGRKEGTLLKETFWNKLRSESGYSYEALADVLGHHVSTIGSWFTGKSIPRPDSIRDICKLFGIDEEEGKAEFIKAYTSQKSDESKHTETSDKKAKAVVKHVEKEIKTIEANLLSTILGSVYGKLSFTEYEALRDSILAGKNPQEILYGKVSFEDYIAFIKIVEDIGTIQKG